MENASTSGPSVPEREREMCAVQRRATPIPENVFRTKRTIVTTAIRARQIHATIPPGCVSTSGCPATMGIHAQRTDARKSAAHANIGSVDAATETRAPRIDVNRPRESVSMLLPPSVLLRIGAMSVRARRSRERVSVDMQTATTALSAQSTNVWETVSALTLPVHVQKYRAPWGRVLSVRLLLRDVRTFQYCATTGM